MNPKALEAYLQGNYHLNGYAKGAGDEEKKKAAGYFQQAIAQDSSYAPAYAGLADTYGLMSTWGQVASSEFMPKARTAALRLFAMSEPLGGL